MGVSSKNTLISYKYSRSSSRSSALFSAPHCCTSRRTRYFTVPSVIIALDENRNLLLPRGVVISLRDITEVSSFEAWNHRVDYTWGTITIETKTKKYKYDFVADCAEVERKINDLHRGKKI